MPGAAKDGQPRGTSGARDTVGVLLVHGIGQQQPGETLRDFGEPLIAYLQALTAHPPRGFSDLQLTSVLLNEPGQPASAVVEFEALNGPEEGEEGDRPRWILAESCWATTVLEPGYLRFLSWIVTTGWWAGFLHIAGLAANLVHRFARTVRLAEDGGSSDKTVAQAFLWALAGFCLFPFGIIVAVVVTLTAVMLATVLPILALLPVTKRLADRVRSLLGLTVGDSFVFVTSPIQRAAICTRVGRDLDWLAERSGRVVILAHSQGAAVVVEALRQRREMSQVPLSLVTFGSGHGKLSGLRRYVDRPTIARWYGVGTFAMALVGGALVTQVLLHGTLVTWLGAATVWTALAVLASGAGNLSWVDSQDLLEIPWYDFSATHDPVSTGVNSGVLDHDLTEGVAPLLTVSPQFTDWMVKTLGRPAGSGHPVELSAARALRPHRAFRIDNQASWVSDHTTYWQNVEQFVSNVMEVIGAPGGHIHSAISRVQSARRRRWRVRLLVWFKRTAALALVALPASLWEAAGRMGDATISTLAKLVARQDWIPSFSLPALDSGQVAGLLLVLVALLLVYWINAWLWRHWGRHELRWHYEGRTDYSPRPWSGACFTLLTASLGGATIVAVLNSALPGGVRVVALLLLSTCVFMEVWTFLVGWHRSPPAPAKAS